MFVKRTQVLLYSFMKFIKVFRELWTCEEVYTFPWVASPFIWDLRRWDGLNDTARRRWIGASTPVLQIVVSNLSQPPMENGFHAGSR